MTNRSIVHQVTRRYMHSQIGRTRISFIGIVLMVTLMTCVFVGKDTVLAYFTEITETHYGKWHMAVYDITESQLAQIQALSGVKETAVSQNLHYTAFPQSGDELHPYLNLRTYSDKAFDWMNIQVVEGRLPVQEDEVVISYAAIEDGAQVAIGDTIQADCFRRYIENFGVQDTIFPFLSFSLSSGERKEAPADLGFFPEGDPFYEGHREIHEETGVYHTYTVTGFIEAPSYENRGSAAYTAIGWMGEEPIDGNVNCSIRMDTSQVQEYLNRELAEIVPAEQIEVNNPVLAFDASSSDDTINFLAVAGQIFFLLLISLVSIILMYNLFQLSFAERCRYLGMLSSVGATARQKRSSVYDEAMCLLLPALPIGALLGLGIVYGGVGLLAPLAGRMMGVEHAVHAVPVRLRITVWSVLLTIGFAVVTVLLSSLLPAVRISKTGAIEGIRGNVESSVRKQSRHRLSERWIGWFGAEGMLAAGFLTNQKKKSRGIVRALTMFFIVLSVTMYGGQAVSQMVSYKLRDTSQMGIMGEDDWEYMLTASGHIETVEAIAEELSQMEGISRLQVSYEGLWIGETEEKVFSQEYWDTFYQVLSQYYPEGLSKQEFETEYVSNHLNLVNMISVDTERFRQMLESVQGDLDVWDDPGTIPCIVFQTGEFSTDSYRVWGRQPSSYQFLEISRMTDLDMGEELPFTISVPEEIAEDGSVQMPLTIAGFGTNETLGKWLELHRDDFWVITTNEIARKINAVRGGGLDITVCFQAEEENTQVQAKLQQLNRLQEQDSGIYFASKETYLPETIPAVLSGMFGLVMKGFIGISSVICFLNLYNSVGGLMLERRKEFATLKSCGMTGRQLFRMCRYELYLIFFRSIVIAVPIILFLCKGMEHVMMGRFGHFTVRFPLGLVLGIGLCAMVLTVCIAGICCRRNNKADHYETFL